MNGDDGTQDWDAYPPGTYVPPQPVYGPPPGYGPTPPYGPPAYGPAPWNLPAPVSTWPHGPGRPSAATAAIVLGFVTGGLTALASLLFLLMVVVGDGDLPTIVLATGLPCAVGLIAGAAQLLRGQSPGLLFGSAAAAIGVLALVLLAGTMSYYAEDMAALAMFVVAAAVLPVLTAVFARLPRVVGWAGYQATYGGVPR